MTNYQLEHPGFDGCVEPEEIPVMWLDHIKQIILKQTGCIDFRDWQKTREVLEPEQGLHYGYTCACASEDTVFLLRYGTSAPYVFAEFGSYCLYGREASYRVFTDDWHYSLDGEQIERVLFDFLVRNGTQIAKKAQAASA